MRLGMSLAVAGMVLCGTALPALAQLQQQQQQQQPSYVYGGGNTNSMPLYNAAPSYTQQTNGASLYNNGANLQMLPMQQLTAGKNAPSYTYGGSSSQQPYNFNYNSGLDPTASGGLTPDQARMIRAQRDAQAQAYQQQYLEQLRQRDMNDPYAQQIAQQQQQAGSMYQGAQFNQLYADNGQQKPPVKRKVIYNQLNNPLVDPPRLFNPDK